MNKKRFDFPDSLAVGLLKECEKSNVEGDESLHIDVNLDKSGKIANPAQYLSERAAALLPSKAGISAERIRKIATWLFRGPTLAILFLAGAIYPLARANAILGSGSVNLAGPYLFFLAFQLLFLAISLFSLFVTISFFVVSLFRRPFRRTEASEWGKNFGVLSGWLGGLVLGAIRRVGGWWTRKRSLRTMSDSERSALEARCTAYFDKIFDRQRAFWFFGSFLSHLFWLTLSAVVLLILLTRMVGNRYDYCWNSSLMSFAHAEKVVHLWGLPVQKMKIAAVPDEREIRWLFENSGDGVPAKEDKLEPVEEAKIRKDWSWFLLCVVFVWAVVPRLFFTLVYRGLYRFFLRDFSPDLTDPYYREILERAKSGPRHFRTEIIQDAQPGPLESPKLQTTAAVRTNTPPTAPSETLLLGYDASMPEAQWRSIFGADETLRVFGNVAQARESLRAFADQIADSAGRYRRAAVLLDVGFPPAQQTRLFLQNRLFAPLSAAELFVILSCGERMRKKFASDAEAVRQRLDDWRDIFSQMEKALSRKITLVDCYDHELDLPESRRRLQSALGIAQAGTTACADKFPAAKKTILAAADALFDQPSLFADASSDDEAADAARAVIRRGYEELRTLYREEETAFFDSANRSGANGFDALSSGISAVGDRLKSALVSGAAGVSGVSEKWKQLDTEALSARLSPVLAVWQKAKSLKLSPKCAICFGALGASIPVLAVAAPILGGTAGAGAVLAAAGTLLPSTVTSGLLGAAAGAALPAGLSALKNRLAAFSPFGSRGGAAQSEESSPADSLGAAAEAAVISLTVWALIFELQGFPEDVIAETLPTLLEPLETATLAGHVQAAVALDGVEEKKRAFFAGSIKE